jgi:hypothetical protein
MNTSQVWEDIEDYGTLPQKLYAIRDVGISTRIPIYMLKNGIQNKTKLFLIER